jgi:hypothetical protein
MTQFWEQAALAFRCFFSILLHGHLPSGIDQKVVNPGDPTAPIPSSRRKEDERSAPEACDRAVQILALLQRDGRRIELLKEDISAYPDAQLGAAVRRIHETCRVGLERYVKLEPILSSEEDKPVTVPAGFDTAAIKLIGNVAGDPPVRGVLRHRGWRVREVVLPPLQQGLGRMVVAPAEVELS